MFTIKLDGEDLVLAQDDREVVRRTVPLDGDRDACHDVVTDVSAALLLALDEVVKHAWRSRHWPLTDSLIRPHV